MTGRRTDLRNRLPRAGAGFVWDTSSSPVLRVDADVPAAFTTRVGGVSTGPWAELNVSFAVGDDAASVRRNRDIAGRCVDADGRWSPIRQVHGCDVVHAHADGPEREADAIWTDDPDRVLAILVADCVPVLVVGDGRVAAAHAGWRGLVGGVVGSACDAVRARRVFAGPAIGPCCFEVGPEVTAAFRQHFGGEPIADERHVDLWIATELAARRAGAEDVRSARVCTSCHPELFFSHRRDGGVTGRQALLTRLPASHAVGPDRREDG